MAVRLTPISEKVLWPVAGVELGVAEAGIRKADRRDLMVMCFCPGTKIAGAFTRNRFCAAPVILCRDRLSPDAAIRALYVNTGVANAGCGELGVVDALAVCDALAHLLGVDRRSILPFSTGVIMERLPVETILSALPACIDDLREDGWVDAAEAIMTTDTMAKAASRRCKIGGQPVTVTGIAKGSGMICPNMATMLAFIATDAKISQRALAELVREVAENSFNLITVDGDTSTNDSFIVAATGLVNHAPINDPYSANYDALYDAIEEVALELALSIVRDGEGATKLITIAVKGGKTEKECRQVARSIAGSPLVKTAFFASDPNLGRILSAIGNGGIEDLNPSTVSVWLGDLLVAEKGARAASYSEEAGQAVMAGKEIMVTVDLNRGDCDALCYTCDLSYDYIKINADYRS